MIDCGIIVAVFGCLVIITGTGTCFFDCKDKREEAISQRKQTQTIKSRLIIRSTNMDDFSIFMLVLGIASTVTLWIAALHDRHEQRKKTRGAQ